MSLLPHATDENDDRISSRFARLKPWQMVLIGAVVVLGLLMLPNAAKIWAKQKSSAGGSVVVTPGASGGEAWHNPTYPEPPVEKVSMVQPVQPPKQSAVLTQPSDVPASRLPSLSPGSANLPDQRMFGQRQNAPPPDQGVAERANHMQSAEPGENSLGSLLKPTATSGFKASRIAKPWATIEEGRIIACTSITPMTSQLAGFVKAQITYDVWSADGTTRLIDRGSVMTGEISRGLAQGQDRLFVLWRKITGPAPDLVRVTLNSPAADELGENGLPGDVNHHIWQKVGGALLLSGIETGIQTLGALIQNSTSHNGNGNQTVYNSPFPYYQLQSQGNSLASSLLQHTLSIPDTLHRDQALPCSAFTSGDLVFDDVYAIRMRNR